MLTLRDLPGPIGAEILGLEAGKPLSPDDLARVNDAFLRRLVLRFRGTPMDPRQLCDFSTQFGELVPHMAFFKYGDVPGVIGKVGSAFGTAGVNIANMAVARDGGKALMAVSFDEAPPAAVIEQLAAGGEFELAQVCALS